MARIIDGAILIAIYTGALAETISFRTHEVPTATFLRIHFLVAVLLGAYSIWVYEGDDSQLFHAAYTYIHISVAYISTFLVTLVINRLFFSPIARFPAASHYHKLSKIPLFLTHNAAKYTGPIGHLHEKYGDVVRIGPNDLSVCNAAIIPMVYHRRTDYTSRGAFYDFSHVVGGKKSMLTMRDPVKHRSQRAVWEKAFSKSALNGYEPRVQSHVAVFLDSISADANKNSGIVNLKVLLNRFTYAVMADLGFGVEPGLVTEEMKKDEVATQKGMRKFVRVAVAASNFRNLCDIFVMIPQFIKGILSKSSKAMFEKSQEMLRNRMAMGEDREGGKDVFSFLLEGAKKSVFDMSELATNARLMILAGSDTTSTVLASLLRALALHPEYQEKLFIELTATGFTHDSPILPDAVTRPLPVLNGILSEAIRLYNPAPGGVEVIVPPEGVTLPASSTRSGKDIFIPGLTTVRVPHLNLFTDDRYFDRPKDFWPERWFPVEGNVVVEKADVGGDEELEKPGRKLRGVKDKRAFTPWSWGAHSCVGRELAMMEIRMVVSAIVASWQWRMKEKDPDIERKKWEEGWKESFTTEVGDVEVEIRKRGYGLEQDA